MILSFFLQSHDCYSFYPMLIDSIMDFIGQNHYFGTLFATSVMVFTISDVERLRNAAAYYMSIRQKQIMTGKKKIWDDELLLNHADEAIVIWPVVSFLHIVTMLSAKIYY